MGMSALVTFAVLFSVGSLLMVTLSFSTDHWIEYTFARAAVQKAIRDGTLSEALNKSLWANPLMYTRYRGLFRTCFPGKETFFLDNRDDVIEDHCVMELGYEILRPLEMSADYPADYETRKHLMRAHVGMFIASMVMLVISCFFGAIGCWRISKRTLMTAGVTLFVGAFFTAGGMAVFHGYEYLENESINLEIFPKGWPTIISRYTNVQYGWSYIVGWIGMAMAVIGALLYLIGSYTVATEKYGEKHPLDDYHYKASRYLEQAPYYPSNYGAQPYHVQPAYPSPSRPTDPYVDYAGYRY